MLDNERTKNLRQKLGGILKEMRSMLDFAEAHKRDLTEEERTTYNALDGQIDVIKDQIKREERVQEIEEESKRVVNPLDALVLAVENHSKPKLTGNGVATRAKDITGYKEQKEELPAEDFFKCLFNRDYGPLKEYKVENRTGAILGSGVAGGYAAPQIVTLNVIDKLLTDQGIFSRIGKEYVEPGTGDTLHAVTFENCEIDDHGLFGFSKPTFVAEGGTIPEGTPRLVSRTWELKKLAMGTRISIEASVAVGDLQRKVEEALAGALKWSLEYYITQGSGVGQPVGLVNSPCMYQYGRAGAGTIAFSDIYGMYAKTRLENNCWIASQETLPALIAMLDGGNHAIYLPGQGQTGAAQKVPNTLFGVPLLTNMGASPGLGEKGDIMFCSDLSFYKAVMWQDLIIRVSEAPYWTTGEVAIQVIMLLDAGPLPANLITVDSQTYGWGTVLK